ncbi:hypothetical protein EPUS_01142 [Endocarpon pusillum Z07020]|uniref:Uncharacterized protein n=1 Tax=Endocarpon pusillum (strain Z07020 / HMAS-L-300199) TaxID=1263415 RepID=U1HGE0_ENDPU|nr:uncharacterized protein EPUS_01142 [Endocarpon pusillum Z07020]ERF69185.1 hypothetical protein EPUS_01142 [Endocarpon pusillum Z07020]
MPPKTKSSKATGSARQSSQAGPSQSSHATPRQPSQPGASWSSRLDVRENRQPNASQSSKDAPTFVFRGGGDVFPGHREAGSVELSGSSENAATASNPPGSRDPPGTTTPLPSDLNVISPAPTLEEWYAAEQNPWSTSVISKPEMSGMVSIKRQASAMSASIDCQYDAMLKVQTSIETTEKIIAIVKAKLQQLESREKSEANELQIQSFKKQIVALQNWMQVRKETMTAWENNGKPKWVAIDKLIMQVMAMAQCWAHCQPPEDMRDFIMREKTVLDRQQAEAVQQRRVMEELEQRVRQLRRKMVQHLPKDFDTGWATYEVQALEINNAIGDLCVRKKQAWRKVADWELAERQLEDLRHHYNSMLSQAASTATEHAER